LHYKETNWKYDIGLDIHNYDFPIHSISASKTIKEQQAKIEKISLVAFLNKDQRQSSQKWYQIVQCPSGINGPLEWKEFDCKIKILQNNTKIHLTLNAGWSSRQDEKAVTSFDAVHLYRIN
jgi:hypothetical protein